MQYLDISEVDTYCDVPGITEKMLKNASSLMDVYLGDISEKTYVDTITLNRKNKGKLKHPPKEIASVKAISRNPFGITEEPIDISSISVDEYGYLEFFGYTSVNQMIFGRITPQLKVEYTSGYAEDEVPEPLKQVCAGIAGNIKRNGWGSTVEELTDLDVKIKLTDNSLVNSDMRQIMSRYRA